MFNSAITNPVSPLTMTYVNSLIRVNNEPDYSLISLATALIKPRVSDYSGIYGNYWFLSGAGDLIHKMEQHFNDRKAASEEAKKNIPAFYYLLANVSSEDMITIRAKAKEFGLNELSVVENFVNQQLNISQYGVFISSENNAAFVVVGSTSMALYHLSISFISLLYPALFKDHPLNKEETEVLKSLTNKTSTNFIERTSVILQYMKADLLRQELTACFKGFRQGRIDRCKREIDDIDHRLDSIMRDWRTYMEQRDNLIIQFEGLQVVNSDNRNQEEQEAIDYLSECPSVHDVSYANNTLMFCTSTLLTNFDLNKWRNVVRRSNIYDSYRLPDDSVFRDRTNRKMLFDNIFSSRPLLYIRTKGYIQLRIGLCDMSAPRGQNEAEVNQHLKDHITNPHFKIHGCPGRNREQIVQCLRQADIVSAIECSIAATGSVNIDETEYTFRPFLQEVLTSKNKILENTSGEKMTPEEALLWLSKQIPKDEEPMPF